MTDKKISTLGNRIDYLNLLKDDLNKNKLAEAIGVSRNTLNNIDNGVPPTLDVLKKISDYFDASTDYLLGYTDIPGRVTSKIDKLHLSDPARDILSSSEEYGHIISLLLESADFRRLLQNIIVYYSNSLASELSEVKNNIANTGKNITTNKKADSNKPADINDIMFENALNNMQNYDDMMATNFANQIAKIITDIKPLYPASDDDRQRMHQIAHAINDISAEMINGIELRKNVSSETFIKSYINAFKAKKVFGEDPTIYELLEIIIIKILTSYS